MTGNYDNRSKDAVFHARWNQVTVQETVKCVTITRVRQNGRYVIGCVTGGVNVAMQKWTKPELVKLDIAETLRGSGPCPDGDGGSEAM